MQQHITHILKTLYGYFSCDLRHWVPGTRTLNRSSLWHPGKHSSLKTLSRDSASRHLCSMTQLLRKKYLERQLQTVYATMCVFWWQCGRTVTHFRDPKSMIFPLRELTLCHSMTGNMLCDYWRKQMPAISLPLCSCVSVTTAYSNLKWNDCTSLNCQSKTL